MIKVDNLNKYYHKGKNNEIHVINDTSLEIKEIGLVAFLGQSGSGKTTLLNIIGGLDSAKGKMQYDDVSIKNYQSGKIDKYRKKNIGYVFQNYSLIQSQTVYDNLRVSLNVVGIYDEKIIKQRIEESLTSVGLYKYRKRLAGSLSGGEQQRVAIARALIKNSKIIIADEPTGNLDSKNAIEVLNILKKISETRLVLLVTHNTNLAEFYADRIIKLQDGKIIDDYENIDRPTEYGQEEARTVFLGDLTSEEEKIANVNIKKYYDNEMPDLELKIVYSKGNIYIESPLKIKLIGANTPVKLVNEKYQKMTSNDVKTDYNFVFEEPTKKQINIKGFFIRFWHAIKSFFVVKKKTYLLYLAFILTGMLMALCAYNIGKYTYVDIDDSLYIKNAYVITNDDRVVKDKTADDLNNANCQINPVCKVAIQYPLSTKYYVNDSEGYVHCDEEVILLDNDNLVKEDLVIGNLPENSNEIVIDKLIAERIIKKYKDEKIELTNKDLLDITLAGTFSRKTIVGIVDTDSTAIYYDHNDAGFLYQLRIENITCCETNPAVTVYEGTNFTDLTEPQCLVPFSMSEVYEIGDAYNYSTDSPKIVGFYYSDDTNNVLFTKPAYDQMRKEFYCSSMNFYCATMDNTKVVVGRLPNTNYELIVPESLGFTVGEKINNFGDEFEIVGLYKDNGNFSAGATMKGYFNNYQYYSLSGYYFFIDNPAAAKEYLTEKGYQIYSSYDYVLNNNNEYSVGPQLGDLFFIIFLAIETVLFIFFMMRAKLISRVKTVGIYRALGARKGMIIKDFLIDLLVLTTFTTLLGYVVGSYAIVKALSSFNVIGELFVINMPVIIACGFGVYFLNVIFGMLPIMLLLRKTPAQIIAKYDI